MEAATPNLVLLEFEPKPRLKKLVRVLDFRVQGFGV